MDKRTRLIKLLSQGILPVQAAKIIGCTPAYISQLSKDPEFKASLEVELARLDQEDEAPEQEILSNKYLAAEHALLDSVIGSAALMDPRDQIRALEVISNRAIQHKKISNPVPNQTSLTQNNVVVLQLPSHSVPEIKVNDNNEIIAIDNRPMAPMTSTGVRNLFQEMTNANL